MEKIIKYIAWDLMIFGLVFSYGPRIAFTQDTQTSQSSLYIPLIGVTSVPEPLTLPNGPGNVTYRYAVKNFLQELSLNDVQVKDNKCNPVNFVGGDDNGDSKLDYLETWRYSCTTRVSETTESVVTATGITNNITATQRSYTTVVVGLSNSPPLVSIVNISKIAYPLSLPPEGGNITFTYKVNNPGIVPLSDVIVTDDKCKNMSSKLGDTNNNQLLDTNEVWVYSCTMLINQTTTNTATVTAHANGFRAVGNTTITVKVEVPNLPDTGSLSSAKTYPNLKIITWGVLSGVLAGLIVYWVLFKFKK